MRAAALAVTAFSAAAAAAGKANVRNNCDVEVFLWNAGNKEAEPLGRFAKGQGLSAALEEGLHEIKVTTKEDALDNGRVQTSLVYSREGDLVLYDLYSIFESPFDSLAVTADGEEGDCESIEWPEGKPIAGFNSGSCSSEGNVTLTLCA